MMVYVDDVEAHCDCEDIGGHYWWFYQRLRNPTPKE